MIKLKRYLLECFCSIKQTDLVWQLLDNKTNFPQLKTFNIFHSFNKQSGEIFATENDKDTELVEVLRKYDEESNSYSILIKEINESNHIYTPTQHLKLSNIAERIEKLKKKIREIKNNILPFKNQIEWICIKYDNFGMILIKLGLPVVSFSDNLWWGYFKENDFPLQQRIIELSEKLHINVGEGLQTNFELIKFALINEGLLKKEEKMPSTPSLKTYEETLSTNIDIISNIEKMSNNPEKLKDFLK